MDAGVARARGHHYHASLTECYLVGALKGRNAVCPPYYAC